MKCTGVKKIDSVANTDMLLITIDDREESLWLFPYAEALQYLNQDVIVDYRNDIYKGEVRRFIATFCIPTVVTTLDRHNNFKLFIEQIDNHSNVSFSDIANGETMYSAKVYCIKSEYKSSAKAVWMELLIRDKSMHVGKLRIFNYDKKDLDFSGTYVLTDLSRDEFGFKATGMVMSLGIDGVPNPEVALATEFITNFFMDDKSARKYMETTDIINHLKSHIDYEAGYGLMRLAMELSMAENLYNIANEIDIKAITHALLASYGYVIRESVVSRSVNNVMIALRTTWDNHPLVIQLLDEALEEKPNEAVVMQNIKNTVSDILSIRKGIK